MMQVNQQVKHKRVCMPIGTIIEIISPTETTPQKFKINWGEVTSTETLEDIELCSHPNL